MSETRLERLVYPIDVAHFEALMRASDAVHIVVEDPDRAPGPASFDAFRALLQQEGPWSRLRSGGGTGRLFARRSVEPSVIPQVQSATEALDLLSLGYCVILSSVEGSSAELGQFCSSLAAETRAEVHCDLVAVPRTPPTLCGESVPGVAASPGTPRLLSAAIQRVIVQRTGRSRWYLGTQSASSPAEGQAPPSPVASSDRQGFRAVGPSGAVHEATGPLLMEEGHCLYLPSGCVASVVGESEACLLSVFRIALPTYVDYLEALITDGAVCDIELRRNIPRALRQIEAADQLKIATLDALSRVFRAGDPGRALVELDRSTAIPQSGHGLASIATLDVLDEDTWIVLRDGGCPVRWGRGTSVAWLMIGDRRVGLPLRVLPYVQTIAERPRFKPSDLPDVLSQGSKTTFCRWLIKQGLAEISAAPSDGSELEGHLQ